MTEEEEEFIKCLKSDDLDIETAKVILEQGEKHLQETINASEQLTTRAFNIMGVIGPITVALLGILVTKYDNIDFIFWYCLIAFGCTLVILHKCFKAYSLYGIKSLGNSPKNNLRELYLVKKDQEKLIIINCIRTVQDSCEVNLKLNKEQATFINQIFCAIKYSIAILIAIPIFCKFIYPLFKCHC